MGFVKKLELRICATILWVFIPFMAFIVEEIDIVTFALALASLLLLLFVWSD